MRQSVDYPDFTSLYARLFLTAVNVNSGIYLSTGTGIGISMAANKFKGIKRHFR